MITAAAWAVILGMYLTVTHSSTRRSHVRLEPSLGELINPVADVESVAGPLSEPGDAADDYYRAVQEAQGTDRYSGYYALLAEDPTLDADGLDIRAPQYLLDGMKKAKMDYTRRFAQPAEWTAIRIPYVKAFDAIGQICTIKADLLARQGRPGQAEALFKAVLVFGYHIERERVRYSQTITGIGVQKRACRGLLSIYGQDQRSDDAAAVHEYLKSLQQLQDRLESKAAATTARLVDASPPPGELFWIIEHDKDRMWRMEATLLLGLTQWTAPRAADQQASRQRLEQLADDHADPLLSAAARAALATTREDVRRVR